MPLTTNDALLETWAEHIETLEQNLETLYGPPGITPTLPDITTEEGLLEAIADEAGKSAWGFAKLYNATTVVSESTMVVTVPSTALYCGEFVKIGGANEKNDEEILTGAVTQVISKDKGGNVIDVYNVPAEVQALTGYGWSAGTVHNYIDYANKKFVQNVGKVTVGVSTTHSFRNNVQGKGSATFNNTVLPTGKTNALAAEQICDKLTTTNANSVYNYGAQYSASTTSNGTGVTITAGATENTSEIFDAWMTELGDVTLYYPLAAPIETDISAYITDDIVKVVPGGTLTFVNEPELDVPSEVEYIGI